MSTNTTACQAEALHSAVAAIYFADSSDYLSALWSVVQNLAPDLVHELREYPKRAFDQSMSRVEAAALAPHSADARNGGALQDIVDRIKAYGDALYCKASATSPVDKNSWNRSAEGVLAGIADQLRVLLAAPAAPAPALSRSDMQEFALFRASLKDAVRTGKPMTVVGSDAEFMERLLSALEAAPAPAPTAQADALQGWRFTNREPGAWLVRPPKGEQWVVFKDTPAYALIETIHAAHQQFATPADAASEGDKSGDACRLDFMASHEAWIAWSKDGESCRVFHRDEEGDLVPVMGWKCPWFGNAREAIDAAMADQAQKGGEHG
ncbi:hypothetical protein [Cupriavidus sp. 2SB]|uniref:hypothetical protein n=1 Tax=Cupriavidus sp. 2SB TaxID=2502199 RepID=UPI0010F5EFF4|nr:hypothetical protein [Cupriavidus sp. 2SB]